MPQTPDLSLVSARFPEGGSAQPSHTALAWLAHEAVIAVNGVDATRFLQGQMTCDVNGLEQLASTLGARCNPKGRMQSSFRLLRTADSDYLLSLERGLLAPQLADLGKYAVFSKVKLEDVSADWLRLGLWGEQADQALRQAGLDVPETINAAGLNDKGLVIRLPDAAYEIWLPAAQALDTLDSLCRIATPAALDAWLLRQIRAGIGQVTALTWESFIPQMLNLQQLGGVSFRKGCYTGQEIVARMQYLGKLKRRMYRLLLAGDTPPAAGAPVLERDSGKVVGEVVMAARDHDGVEILAVLQKDAAQLATLSVVDSQGPALTLADLPYESELAASDADQEN